MAFREESRTHRRVGFALKLSEQLERCPPARVSQLHLGVGIEQQLREFDVASLHGQMERYFALQENAEHIWNEGNRAITHGSALKRTA